MQVNILEAKNQLSRLVKAAQAGEEVIIANHGVPVARLQAVNPNPAQASLADDLAGLRALLAGEDTELTVPARADRANPFADAHVAD